MSRMRLFTSLVLLIFPVAIAPGQSSLSSRVLLVYSDTDPDSQAVAAHYAQARGVPASNFCPVSLPDPNATGLNGADYQALLGTPVQNCLQAAGEANILYIVLAYLRPYAVHPGSGLDNYAVDSYLADIWDQYAPKPFNPYPTREHPYYVESQSQGNVFPPFRSFAWFREVHPDKLIYSVWRLDGETPFAAMNLVDNAMAAEAAGGPISNDPYAPSKACLDLVIDPSGFPDSGYRSADWDLQRAADFLNATGHFSVVADMNNEVFGTLPAPDCPNTALYSGWYNYGQYNDAFAWNIGAIGWDLDSAALADPRGGVWWGSNALQHGITVTSGPMNEPYLEGMARPAGTIRNLLEGANVGDAFLRNTRWLKWMILNVGDPLYTPFGSKLAPFNAPVHTNSLALSPRQLVSGDKQVQAVLTLASPAPSEGLTISLSSENDALSAPATVNLSPGALRVAFSMGTAVVTSSQDIRITASAADFSVTNTASLYPLLGDLRLSATSVTGGDTLVGTVLLNDNAPRNGIPVQIASDNSDIAAVPGSVFIPGGRSRKNFQITTSPNLPDSEQVNLTVSYAGAQVTVTLNVHP